jgi:hypothetical protein
MNAIIKHKIVNNTTCAQNQCTKPANIRIKFSLGFSAGFCSKCAKELMDAKIGEVDEQH